ncbi:hypothetical protein GOP47_0006870 [Adiantum capillus-veneris]|uniref:Uncharacterized protein n=1 Tax=Adiantum capillus-veneris TaxID=13818 RepID=A0A9D4V3P3_ADICA|nr:hypothetical protein GOP47_0006870 [Adiantum capillus-veneris]
MWRLHVSLVSGRLGCVVKAFHDEHNCGGASQLGDKKATVEWVASEEMQKWGIYSVVLGSSLCKHCDRLRRGYSRDESHKSCHNKLLIDHFTPSSLGDDTL